MTIYQCCKCGNDVNKALQPVHYAKTEKEAIQWLEKNGGGVYKNLLHNFQFHVHSKTDIYLPHDGKPCLGPGCIYCDEEEAF